MRGSSSRTESRSHIRGRGSRGFSGRHRGWRTEAPKGQALGGRTDQTGELLRTITLSKIQSSPQFKDITPTIENCEYVASYNWLNKKRPTILVPGRGIKTCRELIIWLIKSRHTTRVDST